MLLDLERKIMHKSNETLVLGCAGQRARYPTMDYNNSTQLHTDWRPTFQDQSSFTTVAHIERSHDPNACKPLCTKSYGLIVSVYLFRASFLILILQWWGSKVRGHIVYNVLSLVDSLILMIRAKWPVRRVSS
jgi:hypothetical protein